MLTAFIAATCFSYLEDSKVQQSSCSVRASHSQRSRKAKPKMRRSRRPSPPRDVGLHTDVQATLHLPPETDLAPTQSYTQRHLSICATAHEDRQHAMLKCTEIADSVTLVSNTRPA